jgi:hypothetical protein
MQVIIAKNMMISEASRKLRPKTRVERIPAGSLSRHKHHVQLETHRHSGHLRKETQEAGEKDGEEVAVLGAGSPLQRHWLDAVFFNTGIKQPLVPPWILFWMRLVNLARIHGQQRHDTTVLVLLCIDNFEFLFLDIVVLSVGRAVRQIFLFSGHSRRLEDIRLCHSRRNEQSTRTTRRS